jgi:hypothetical protein
VLGACDYADAARDTFRPPRVAAFPCPADGVGVSGPGPWLSAPLIYASSPFPSLVLACWRLRIRVWRQARGDDMSWCASGRVNLGTAGLGCVAQPASCGDAFAALPPSL